MNNGSPKKVSQQCQTPVQNASNPCTTQILSSSQPQLDKSMISTMTSGSPKLLSNTQISSRLSSNMPNQIEEIELTQEEMELLEMTLSVEEMKRDVEIQRSCEILKQVIRQIERMQKTLDISTKSILNIVKFSALKGSKPIHLEETQQINLQLCIQKGHYSHLLKMQEALELEQSPK